MPGIARLVVKYKKAVYHVMSRTALDGYVPEDVENDFLPRHIRRLQKVYFSEVLGLCEYRKIFFKPYRIIYRVMGKIVHVLIIVDRRRAMQSLLQRRLLNT